MELGAKPKYKDEKKCIKEGLEKTVILVQQWLDKGKITGVVEFNGMVHREMHEIIDDWIYQPRLVGKCTKKVQVFFKVQIAYVVPELVKAQLDYYQKNKLTVINKVIGPEYTKKIGFLSGVNIKIS